MDLSQPRGIRDIEPEEQRLHQRVRTAFDQTVWSHNFNLMEPGPLELIDVLRAKSGSQVDEQIYSFRDKADREIGLRFDLTVGMTRYVASKKGLKPPVKLASYGGVWRYDEPQHARYRWFYQWDVEVFGDQSVHADAEVMDFSHALFRRVGLERVRLEVGDRRVVEEYIRKSLRVSSDEKLLEMMRALDKVAKKSEPELIEEYGAKGVPEGDMEALLKFGKLKGPPDEVVSRLEEFHLDSARGLAELRDVLRTRGIENAEYNLSIVRGLDYYTATVFEVVDLDHPELGSLCGGGRYDVLPRLFGRPDLPATGAAGGVERIAMSLALLQDADRRVDLPPSVYVAHTDASLIDGALRMLASLREAGFRSEIAPRGKSLGRQLEEASSGGFRWAVIVGKREAASGLVALRDMVERSEERISPSQIIETIRKKRGVPSSVDERP